MSGPIQFTAGLGVGCRKLLPVGHRRPLDLVVVGGLIVSQGITLFFTPVIHLYLEVFQENVLDRIPFFRRRERALAGAAQEAAGK